MTAELVAFLRDRLDETVAKAEAARPRPEDATAGHWVAYLHMPSLPTDDQSRKVHLVGCQEPDGREWVVAETGQADRAQAIADHIARHDPARVLAEANAKRALIDACERADTSAAYPDFEGGVYSGLHDALEYLALPYADHPDYREEWRPDPA